MRVSGNTARANERNILVLDGYRVGASCTDRELGAIHTPPIDTRFGCQWPTVKWDIDNLVIANNTIVGGRAAAPVAAMVEINHVADPALDVAGEDRRKSAEAMGVTVGANRFERSQAGVPRWVIGWSRWPSHMAAYETLSSFMTATRQGAGSTYVGP